jgi:hypothetical protein
MSFGLWSCQAASKSSFFFCLRSPAVLSGSSHRECCPAKAFSYFGLRTSRCTGLHGYFLTGILFFSRARNPPTGLRAQERAPVLLSLCRARFWVPPGRSPSVPWSAARSYHSLLEQRLASWACRRSSRDFQLWLSQPEQSGLLCRSILWACVLLVLNCDSDCCRMKSVYSWATGLKSSMFSSFNCS